MNSKTLRTYWTTILRKSRIKKVSFEQSFERGEVLSISHFLRQVVPEGCGFYGEQPFAVSGCATGWNIEKVFAFRTQWACGAVRADQLLKIKGAFIRCCCWPWGILTPPRSVCRPSDPPQKRNECENEHWLYSLQVVGIVLLSQQGFPTKYTN